jgi:hypothetical protein
MVLPLRWQRYARGAQCAERRLFSGIFTFPARTVAERRVDSGALSFKRPTDGENAGSTEGPATASRGAR